MQQRREHVEQLAKLGGGEGKGEVVGEMVHLDPGSNPSHELESLGLGLGLGLGLEQFLSVDPGIRVRVRVRVRRSLRV